MKLGNKEICVIAFMLLCTITSLVIGFWSGTIARTHGGVMFPLFLFAIVAAVVLTSVALVFAGWRMATSWPVKLAASFPLSVILAAIAFLVYAGVMM
jgi:hypothetical protein